MKYSIDPLGQRLDYTWDKSNNLQKVAGPNGYNEDYTYGKKDNRLINVYARMPIDYNYDENGKVFKIGYGSNYWSQHIIYHPNNWVNIIYDPGFPGKYEFRYNYYDNGNISSMTSWVGTESFTYGNLNRLTNWTLVPRTGTTTQENYTYDAAGNLTSKAGTTYTYNNANQIDGFTYDNNGNLTADGTYNYTYNAEDQLIRVNRASDNSLVATYTYYYNGLRKSKTVGATTTSYYYDKDGNLVKDSNYKYFYDPSGKLLKFQGSTTYTIHRNARGDVVSVESSGNIYAQYQYDPWGKIISSTQNINQPFRYAGYFYDDETGLYYLKSRYYSPTLGRFLTRDAHSYIKYTDPQTLNLYAYCGNNPVNAIDPDGTYEIHYIDSISGCEITEYGPDEPDDDIDEGHDSCYDRSPDFYIFEGSGGEGVGLTGDYIVDRYNNYYLSAGPSLGKAATPVSGSVMEGWIDQAKTPSDRSMTNFLNGTSTSFVAGPGAVEGRILSNGKTAIVRGAGVPQLGGSVQFTLYHGKLKQ